MDVSFGDAGKLYALWGLVPLILLLLHGRRERGRAAARLLDPPMRARLSPARRGLRGAAPSVLLVCGLACLVVAAARPRFGTVYEKVQQRGADLVVVLDVSRSMLSRDVHPSRLERSKAYVRDLLARAGGHRVGLVVFAGRPVAACPLTADLAFFESVLDDVSPASAPRGGTVIGDALRRAVDVLDPMPDRDQAFVLITDGEDQDSFPLEAAAAAAERGVRIFTVGIGDPDEGARVPSDDAADGGYVTLEGQPVVSRMDEELLQAIARETRGAYVPARTGTYDLGDVYVEHLASLRAGALREEERRRRREQYQLFAGVGLLLLLGASLVRPTTRRAATAAALLLVLGAGVAGPARAAETATKGVETFNRAVERLARGDVDEAAALFGEAADLLPDEPMARYGRGVAEQRRGALEEAESDYAAAARSGDARATAWARYNLGTVEVERAKEEFGGPAEDAVGAAREAGTAAIERAIAEFRAALRIDPRLEEARYNLELLRVWLKHVRDVWARKDAEREEQEAPDEPPDPVAMLEALLDDQQRLEDEAREGPAAAADLASRQEELGPRVAEVRELLSGLVEQSTARMKEALEAQGGLGPDGDLPDEARARLEQARGALVVPLERAGEAVERAASALAAGDAETAGVAQAAVRKGLSAPWSVMADVPKALERAITVQDDVLGRTDAHADAAAEAAAVGTRQRQEHVAAAATVLGAKAQATLGQIEQASSQPMPDEVDDATRQQLEQQRARMEALVPMLEKAVENAPEVPPLAAEAGEHLEAGRYAEARAIEEEIRRLLEEIRELQPPEEQDPQQQQQHQDDESTDESEDGEGEQDDEQEQDGNEEEQEGPQDPQDPQDAPPSEAPPQEPKDQDAGSEPRDPERMSPREMQALLQRALDRERELKEKEKALERLLGVPVPVERDW